MTSFIPTFNKRTKAMVDNLEQQLIDQNTFDISKNIYACTLDMVCGKFICDKNTKIPVTSICWKSSVNVVFLDVQME